ATAPMPASVGTASFDGDENFDGKTREMPAVSLEALGLSMGDAEPEITEFTPPPTAPPQAASAGDGAAARAATYPPASSAVPEPVPREASGEASVDIDMVEEEPEAVPARPYRRTQTVALSEEDLEELMDAEASGDAAPRAARGGDGAERGDAAS